MSVVVSWVMVSLTAGLVLGPPAAGARTITLTMRDAERAASINANHPYASWAGHEPRAGRFRDDRLSVSRTAGVLLQFPLDGIPPGHQIVNAELSVMVYGGKNDRLFVWRLLADWGAGVGHLFRRTRPERLAWGTPGARGSGVDRAIAPTRVLALKHGADVPWLEVSNDVRLWYTGAAPNHGWLLSSEDQRSVFWFYSFTGSNRRNWKLRVTYEPR